MHGHKRLVDKLVVDLRMVARGRQPLRNHGCGTGRYIEYYVRLSYQHEQA